MATAGICLLRGRKSVFSPRKATRCTSHVKFDMAKRHVGPLAVRNFTSQRWYAAPKVENLHCLVKIRPARANPLSNFYKNVRNFHMLNCISVLLLTWFTSHVTELLQRNRSSVIYPEFIGASCRKKKLCVHHVKFGRDRTTCIGCRCENKDVCVFFTGRTPCKQQRPVFRLLSILYPVGIRSSAECWQLARCV